MKPKIKFRSPFAKMPTRGKRKALSVCKHGFGVRIKPRARLGDFRFKSRVRIRKGTEIRHATKGQPVAIFFTESGEQRCFRGELVDERNGLYVDGWRFGEYFEDFLPLRKIRFWFYENDLPWEFRDEE